MEGIEKGESEERRKYIETIAGIDFYTYSRFVLLLR